MLSNAKDIQANFVGQDGHANHLFQSLACADLLVRMRIGNEFAKGMDADFHDSSPPHKRDTMMRHCHSWCLFLEYLNPVRVPGQALHVWRPYSDP